MFPASNSGAFFFTDSPHIISPIRPQLVLNDAPRLDVSFAEFIFIEVKNNVSQFKGLGFFYTLLVGNRMISTRTWRLFGKGWQGYRGTWQKFGTTYYHHKFPTTNSSSIVSHHLILQVFKIL
jgi:hypothetical protein